MLSVGMLGTTLRLSRPEAQELQARARSRVLRAGDVRRARLILMLSEGQSWSAIQQALGCSSAYIARWQARFAQQRLAGLFARHQGRPATKRTARLEARILAWTRRAPMMAPPTEQPQAGAGAGDQSHDGGAGLAARRA